MSIRSFFSAILTSQDTMPHPKDEVMCAVRKSGPRKAVDDVFQVGKLLIEKGADVRT